MTRRLPRAIAFALAAAVVAPSVASAHGSVKAIVIMKPGQPRADETCSAEVSVLAPPGSLTIEHIEGVRIRAEMTGHNMTPIEASLSATGAPGGYAGTFALTMGGPWKLTLLVTVDKEDMWGEFPVEAVRADQTGDPVGMRHVIEMSDPIRANLFSPWQVVGWTLGLILLLEIAAAITLKLRGPGRRISATVSK